MFYCMKTFIMITLSLNSFYYANKILNYAYGNNYKLAIQH